MGGRLWPTVVHAANGADGPSAKVLLDNLDEINHRLDLFFGDMAYNGVFADAVVAGGYRYEKAAKPESKQVIFVAHPLQNVLRKHWVLSYSFLSF